MVFVGVVLSGCVWSDDDVETESATTDPPECTTVCEVGVCQVLECDDDNVCVAEERPAGSMDDDISGDCRGLICDGEGSWDVVITNDPPLDQRGDCMMPVCDDAGGVVLVLDQSDQRRYSPVGRRTRALFENRTKIEPKSNQKLEITGRGSRA